MSMTADNPRAVVGSNTGDAPDYALMESERLRQDYAEVFRAVREFLADYEKVPEVLKTQEDKETVVGLIKRARDLKTRIVGYHDLEKQPHLRRGQAVDQTFYAEHDLIAKRDKRANDGAADALQKRLTDFDVRELAILQARRRQEALDARKEADQVLAEAEQAEREAAAARRRWEALDAAAARARKAETIAARQEEARAAGAEAEKAADRAVALQGEVAATESRAQDAHISTLQRPADAMRQRHADGSLSGMDSEKFAEIIDRETLDLEKLRPHIAFADLEKALRGYANSQAYSGDASVQIAGARFGKRPRSKVR